MVSNETIVRYTKEELDEMVRRGDTLSNWAHVDALTEDELEAAIDIEEEGLPEEGTLAIGMPGPTERVTMYFDEDIVGWFRETGDDWKTRINEVLRAYMESHAR